MASQAQSILPLFNSPIRFSRGVFLLMMVLGSSLMLGCDSESISTVTDDEVNRLQFVANWEGDAPNSEDAFQFNSAEIVGSQLNLSVSYSGGCSEHSFKLYASSMQALSIPPGIIMWATHNGHDDACEAFLTETLSFNIDELLQDMGGPFWIDLYVGDSESPERIVYQTP